MTGKASKGSQFGLAALMWGVVVCAVIFGIVANMSTTYRVSIVCQKIPADDELLVRWFNAEDGVKNAVASRNGNVVTIEFSKRLGGFQVLNPPLVEFGYLGLQSMESNIAQPSPIGGAISWIATIPPLAWFGIAGLFLAFQYLNRVRGATGDDESIE